MRLRSVLLVLLLLPWPTGNATKPLEPPAFPGDVTMLDETFQGAASLAERGWRAEGAGFALRAGNATTERDDGTYAAGIDARLVAPALDLRHAAPHARLALRAAWDFAPGDGGFVEAHVVGDASGWREIAPVVPEDATVREPGILEGNGYALYDGTLATGEPGFVGSSGNATRAEFDLAPFVGSRVEIALHVRSASPLPPQSFGWRVEEVQARATMGAPDVALEWFLGLQEGQLVATSALGAPTAVVANLRDAPLDNASVLLTATAANGSVERLLATSGPVPPGGSGLARFADAIPWNGPVTLCASLVANVDADATDEGACVNITLADVAAFRLGLAQDDAMALNALGAAKTVHLAATNVGTVTGATRVGLWAWQDGEDAKQVASARLDPLAPGDAARVDLRWTPPQRGTWLVQARAGNDSSEPLVTYVDAAPAPALAEDFATTSDATRAWRADAADRLEGWTFGAWGLANGTPVALPPMAPGGTHALAAWARDGAANASFLQAPVPVTLVLPGAAPPPARTGGNASAPLNLSAARLLLLACPPSCEDPADRVGATNLTMLEEERVADDELTLSASDARLAVANGTIRMGGADGSLLYVVANATATPGAQLAYGPLVLVSRDGNATFLPGGRAWPYDGGASCCVFGPYRAGDLAPAADGTRAVGRYEIERDLSDLVRGAGPGQLALAFETRGNFSWNGSAGVRGHVQLVAGLDAPDEAQAARPVADAATFEAPTPGWQGVLLPINASGPLRLRLVLETVGNLSQTLAGAPDDPTWLVDEVRVLSRLDASQPWRLAGRADGFEDGGASWSGAWNAGGVDAPTAHGRGWSVVDLPDAPPHLWSIDEGTLRWRQAPGLATTEPIASAARTPFLDLSSYAAQQLRFETTYDFGAEQGGRNLAGGSLVAVLEANATSPEERVLLPLDSYGGDVDAPAFASLAPRAPVGATASAWVGSSGWTSVRASLGPVADAIQARRRVAIEFDAVSAGPLRGDGWAIRALRIGAPGPAHDLALAGLDGLPSAVGRNVTTPIVLNVTNLGAFAPRALVATVTILNASGAAEYGPTSVRVDDPAALPPPGASRLVPLPVPWTPADYGPHLVRASLATEPADEATENDAADVSVDVRDVMDASLAAPPGGIVSEDAAPGVPTDVRVEIVNRGTLPLDATRPATVLVEVQDASGASVLDAPLAIDVASARGRALGPGERATLALSGAWTPPASGVYRVVASLALGDAPPRVEAVQTLRVEERVDAGLDAAVGAWPWSNATGAWTFVPQPSSDAALDLAPLELSSAASATLEVRHRVDLEDGFDGGRLEALAPSGSWVAVPPRGGEPGALQAPNAIDPAAVVSAFTGRDVGERTDSFDLAAAPALRERVALPTDGERTSVWMGPAPEGNASAWYVGPHDAPADPPANAAGHLRVDALAFPLDVPASATGDLRVDLRAWAQLGASGDPRAPPSDVRVVLDARGERTPAEVSLPNGQWADAVATFAGAASEYAGRSVRIVVESRQVAVPSPLRTASGPAFSDDLAAPVGGVAVESLAVTAGAQPLALGNATAAAAQAWLLPGDDAGEDLPAAQQDASGFHPLRADDAVAWQPDGASWRLANVAGRLADARLVVPLDFSVAVANVTFSLDDERALSAAHDPTRDENVSLSRAWIEASEDGGRSWSLVAELGNGTNASVDLSAFAGRPVLVALRGALGTSPAARGDSWEVRGLRLDADLFRGGTVRLRFRGVSDASGTEGGWTIENATLRVVRHGEGAGVRLLAPTDAPLTQGYRSLVFEVVNRGATTWPGGSLHVLVWDPAEWGPRPPHDTTRDVPALDPGHSTTITIRGADINWALAANASASHVVATLDPAPGETFLADNVVDTWVGGANVRERSLVVPLRLDALPQVAAPGSEITFRANVSNDGEDLASLAPSTLDVIRASDGVTVRTLTNARPLAARLASGQGLDVVWRWKPDPGFPVGDYVAVAHLATTTARGPLFTDLNVSFHVGPFVGDLAGLERFGPTGPGWICLVTDPCAREDEQRYASAPSALDVGLPPSSATDTALVASLASPAFPARAPAAWIRFVELHDLPVGANATVYAAPVFGNGTQGAWTPLLELRGRSAGAAAGRFVAQEIDASALVTGDVAALRLRFDAPRPPAGNASFLVVDDVSISPLDASLGPLPDAAIPDAAHKRLRFEVRNDGALADAYEVTLADAAGRPAALPVGWTARLLDDSGAPLSGPLAVPAHASRALLLDLATAPSLGAAPLRGPVALPIRLRSTLLPTLARGATWTLHAAGEPRPELAIQALRVLGDDAPPGQPRTVELALSNLGLADATASLALLARAPAGINEAPVDLSPSAPLALAAGASRVVDISWAPAHAGAYRLEARLDPDALVPQADRALESANLTSLVPPLPLPDLRVSLRVDDERPAVGAIARWNLTVENHGGATARGVEATLAAGVESLLDGEASVTVGDLAPGASWSREGDWVPDVPGPVRLVATAYARAGAPEPVATLDDNAATLARLVREEAAHVAALPADAPLAARFRLTNLGNANETFLLEPVAPDGWGADTTANGSAAASVTLAPSAWTYVELRTLPPEGALAGATQVSLAAIGEDGTAHRGEGTVDVARHDAIDLVLLPSGGAPGNATLRVLVDNRGNVASEIHLRAEGFRGAWSVGAPVLRSAPGERRVYDVPLDLGADDAPGDVPVALDWVDADLSGRAGGTVSVEPLHHLDLDVEGSPLVGGSAPLRVTLRNLGNLPEEGVVAWALPPGIVASPASRGARVGPHASATLAFDLASPVDRVDGIAATLRFAGTTDAAWNGTLAPQLADVALDNATRDGARWHLVAENRGDVAMDAVAELYVDGAGVASAPLGTLAPGAVAEADLAWSSPVGGNHTIALEIAPTSGQADARPENNGRVETVAFPGTGSPLAAALEKRATPGPSWALGLAFVALVAFARRRSQ